MQKILELALQIKRHSRPARLFLCVFKTNSTRPHLDASSDCCNLWLVVGQKRSVGRTDRASDRRLWRCRVELRHALTERGVLKEGEGHWKAYTHAGMEERLNCFSRLELVTGPCAMAIRKFTWKQWKKIASPRLRRGLRLTWLVLELLLILY